MSEVYFKHRKQQYVCVCIYYICVRESMGSEVTVKLFTKYIFYLYSHKYYYDVLLFMSGGGGYSAVAPQTRLRAAEDGEN